MPLCSSTGRPIVFIRKIPWTATWSVLREHFVQFDPVRRCTVPFDKGTGFHRGMDWVQFSSEEEVQNALQQEHHILEGVNIRVQPQKPKFMNRAHTSDEKKDF
uniref:SRA stem-loop-interacting RNA-binding protein, mitochondrial pseudogene n=1 Tax=Rattus norvegicus TaxID=10116 RepID=A0A8I6G749_RAT